VIITRPEMAQRGEGGIGERNLRELPLARIPAVAFGGEQTLHHGKCRDHVPHRHDVIDRPVIITRPGDIRKSGGGVDRVVDRDAAVPAADDVDHNQVVAPRLERRVIQPAPRRQVGDDEARVRARLRHQRLPDLAAFALAHVEHDRALALVEAGPVEAASVLGHRPAAVVQPAAHGIDTNDVGAHLGQQQSGIGRGDEGRGLDHPHALEHLVHGNSL
jgi:hypothetical protein